MKDTVDSTQRKAARIAGLSYLISFVTLIAVNFGIFARLIVRKDLEETARNIVQHERLFRLGIAGDLLYCVGLVVVLSALYVVLRPVNQNLALFAAFGRLILCFTWLLVALNLFTALKLLTDAQFSRTLGQGPLQALMGLQLSGSDQYYIGLLFWSLSATVVGYLWFKSGYIPKWLAGFGALASAWCVACTLAYYIFPGFENVVNLWWFDSPMVVSEIVTSFWLLIKGLGSSGLGKPDRA